MLPRHPPRNFLAILAAIALFCNPAARAQDAPVYRCGNSYSSKPCAGGKAVDAADPRSAEQQRQARIAADRDAAFARKLTLERQADEKRAAKLGATNVGPAPAPTPKPVVQKAGKKKHVKVLKVAKPAKTGKAAASR